MLQPLFEGEDLGLREGREGMQGRAQEDTGDTLTRVTFILLFPHLFSFPLLPSPFFEPHLFSKL